MNYAIKEAFLTVQGEGFWTGRVAMFLRFAGCNMWTGLERDRRLGCSAWCDTDFRGTDGQNGGWYTASQLVGLVQKLWAGPVAPFVVLTGGEPLLQVDAVLLKALRGAGFFVAVETNGTLELPGTVDHVCMSPKTTLPQIRVVDELKLVYPASGMRPEQFDHIKATHRFLQPLDDARREMNTKAALRYCMANPEWRLSTQIHKALGVP